MGIDSGYLPGNPEDGPDDMDGYSPKKKEEMKIRSITDVITNSSTEVFSMKISDYEKLPEGLLSRKDRGVLVFFRTIEDVEEKYREDSYLACFDDLPFCPSMFPYTVSGEVIDALKFFGHTDSDIKAYEEHREKTRIAKRNSIPEIQKLVGTVWGFWFDHDWGDLDRLIRYLDQSKIPYLYWEP